MNNILFETIKINNGIIENIEYHQKRFDTSRAKLFKTKDKVNLIDFINPPKNGLFRCKISYDKDIKSIEYATYVPRIFKKFKVILSNIEYTFKYANRKEFEDLKSKYSNFDEIIIEKNGFLTDTTISNIAFFDGKKWLTPALPLLKGTMRAKLIDGGFLELADIKSIDIQKFEKLALINAMIGFMEIKDYYIEN